MKAVLGIRDKRLNNIENPFLEIVNYDYGNDYPQRMLYTLATSGVGISCVNLYAKYIRGRGFADQIFNKAVVNRKGETIMQVLTKAAKDFSRHHGFALHLNYNILGQITEVNNIPFSYTRLCLPDDSGYVPEIAIHSDWNRKKKRYFDKNKIARIDIFNPRPDIVQSQIEQAKGIENYRGQVMWHSAEGVFEYPISPYDAVIQDIEAEGRIKPFKLKNISNGFLNLHMLLKKGRFAEDADRTDFMDTIKSFQGENETNSIMLIETEVDEEIPTIQPLDSKIDDKLFSYTETSTTANIIQAFGQPPVLLGILNNTQNGDSNTKYEEAKLFYDEYTMEERMMFSEKFGLINKYFATNLCPTGLFDIIQQSGLVKVGGKRPLIEQIALGPRGTVQALFQVLQDVNIKPQEKINILNILFGIPIAEAQAIINGNVLPDD